MSDDINEKNQLIHFLVTQVEPYIKEYGENGIKVFNVLALFAAGRLDEAEVALKLAAEKSPKVWIMLHAVNPKRPASRKPGYITVGGNDEAYEYRQSHLALWRSTGALKWGAGIKLPVKPKAKPAPDERLDSLF